MSFNCRSTFLEWLNVLDAAGQYMFNHGLGKQTWKSARPKNSRLFIGWDLVKQVILIGWLMADALADWLSTLLFYAVIFCTVATFVILACCGCCDLIRLSYSRESLRTKKMWENWESFLLRGSSRLKLLSDQVNWFSQNMEFGKDILTKIMKSWKQSEGVVKWKNISFIIFFALRVSHKLSK